MLKNIDETVGLLYEKRQEWIREIKEKRDYKGLQRARVVLSAWPIHQRSSPGETSV